MSYKSPYCNDALPNRISRSSHDAATRVPALASSLAHPFRRLFSPASPARAPYTPRPRRPRPKTFARSSSSHSLALERSFSPPSLVSLSRASFARSTLLANARPAFDVSLTLPLDFTFAPSPSLVGRTTVLGASSFTSANVSRVKAGATASQARARANANPFATTSISSSASAASIDSRGIT